LSINNYKKHTQKQNKTKQNKTKQTKQNKTKQNKTKTKTKQKQKQNKTKQNKTCCVVLLGGGCASEECLIASPKSLIFISPTISKKMLLSK
jgi:hypothetical protein